MQGPIALDVATIFAHRSPERLAAYVAGAEGVWPELGPGEIRRLGGLGTLMRVISAVYWASLALRSPRDLPWTIHDLDVYDARLTELIDQRIWQQ